MMSSMTILQVRFPISGSESARYTKPILRLMFLLATAASFLWISNRSASARFFVSRLLRNFVCVSLQ